MGKKRAIISIFFGSILVIMELLFLAYIIKYNINNASDNDFGDTLGFVIYSIYGVFIIFPIIILLGVVFAFFSYKSKKNPKSVLSKSAFIINSVGIALEIINIVAILVFS